MSSGRYPKRRRVSAQKEEDSKSRAPVQAYTSSPDELAASSDRERYHGRRPTSQPKRGSKSSSKSSSNTNSRRNSKSVSKSRKTSQPDIAEENDPIPPIVTSAKAAETLPSDDELNLVDRRAAAAKVPESPPANVVLVVNKSPVEEDPSTLLLDEPAIGIPSDHLSTPNSPLLHDNINEARTFPGDDLSHLTRDANVGSPESAITPLAKDDEDNMPDAASPPSIKHYENRLCSTATGISEHDDIVVRRDERTSPLKSKNISKLPNEDRIPRPPRRRSTFKKFERQPHDRSTSRSPPPFSTISIPAATPSEPLIGPPQYVPYKQKMVLKGHRKAVAAVRFSPDGRLIASCSADATIRIWDTATGGHLNTLEGHLAGISTIAWSPDSKTLASGSDDKSIRLWDVSTGKAHPHPLIAHSSYVYALSFSPRGNMLASGSYDEALFLWDVRTSRLIRSHPAHSDPIGGVDFVRDGTLIVSCASDGLIRVWDTATGQCLRTLVHEDNAAVTSVRFSPNGKFILASTLDSSIRLWNYVEGRCVKTYQGHTNGKYSIGGAFGMYDNKESTEQRSFAVSGSEDGSLFVWDVQSKAILQRIEGHDGVVLGVDTWPEGELMVSVGLDQTVRVWERDERKETNREATETGERADSILVDKAIKDEDKTSLDLAEATDQSMTYGGKVSHVSGDIEAIRYHDGAAEQVDVKMADENVI